MEMLKNSLGRVLIIALAAVLQIFIYVTIFFWFRDKAGWITVVIQFASALIILGIIRNSQHLSVDVGWIFLIFVFPIPGTILYIFLGADLLVSRTYKRIIKATEKATKYYPDDSNVLAEMKEKHPDHKGQFEYISSFTGYSFYKNRELNYYKSGELGFPKMLQELRKAKKFIFIEYFIIETGYM
ncbi:MAG: hypothetical protein J6S49_01115, partial [Erysipelotrichaceae bacterium]|nr:hypothetical protein [Erysipelotrichaceae bacterium]